MNLANKGAYLKNLEMARKALIQKLQSSIGSTQEDQVEQKETSETGLMRPRMRPESVERQPEETGLGLQLMKEMSKGVPKESPTPQLRPTGGAFGDKLKHSESSGNHGAQIELDDGRTMTGAYQFSDARLADFKKSTGMEFSTSTFKRKPKLQEEVFKWHMKDIDDTIDNMGGSEKYSKDGLRAVAHLGGKTGMKKYVKTKGKYNPKDANGTRLSDYYNKFKTEG
tara:strand:- start:1870 stop:2544 length:675 start_codon:yes stop_codon:yes gene_type:complete